MILEKGECVLTEERWQCESVRGILSEHGYRFHHGDSLEDALTHHGFRYWHGGEYPNCIATLNQNMAISARKDGRVTRNEGPYVVLTYEEFIDRLDTKLVSVEDML